MDVEKFANAPPEEASKILYDALFAHRFRESYEERKARMAIEWPRFVRRNEICNELHVKQSELAAHRTAVRKLEARIAELEIELNVLKGDDKAWEKEKK